MGGGKHATTMGGTWYDLSMGGTLPDQEGRVLLVHQLKVGRQRGGDAVERAHWLAVLGCMHACDSVQRVSIFGSCMQQLRQACKAAEMPCARAC